MRRTRASRALMLAIVAVAALVTPSPAGAEWFTDLYLGLSITSKADVDFAATTPATFIPKTFNDVTYENSVLWGARGGYWFGGKDVVGVSEALGDYAQYVGAALDLSYFRPRIPSQTVVTNVGTRRLGFMDLWITTLTPELMIRFPVLRDEDYPQGRVQPYIAGGPTLYIAKLTDSAGNFGPRGDSSTTAGLGITIGPGLAFQISEQFFAFGEVRFLHAGPSFGFKGGDTDVPLNSHQILFGVSYRF